MLRFSPVQRPRLVCVGSYPPRQCGIATFTKDLSDGITTKSEGGYCCDIFAMNDRAQMHAYPEDVRFEIQQNQASDYRVAAEFANQHCYEAMLLQHEYGIFGGSYGEHVVCLLENTRVPVVTTFHTVLPEPPAMMRRTTQSIIDYSDRIVVMSQTAAEMLIDHYDIVAENIRVIPHGIPDLPFGRSSAFKKKLGLEGKTVMLTFGLLSPGKGIEYAIGALPKLVANNPDLIYLVVGATHPHVRLEYGEEYRQELQKLAIDLGVSNHLVFHDCYVTSDELGDYLQAADIYLTPSLCENQMASGTLAYALGAGKPVVATAFAYAKELLSNDRGCLVRFRDSKSIFEKVSELLDHPEDCQQICERAYDYSRNSTWPKVAESYIDLLKEVAIVSSPYVKSSESINTVNSLSLSILPEVDYTAIKSMTDDVGLFQHAKHTIPDRSHGYCTDDNARALIVALQAFNSRGEPEVMAMAKTYLSFLQHAFNPSEARFRNFMGFNRNWLESVGSEDSHGRALWGLGASLELTDDESMRPVAFELFNLAVHSVCDFTSPRAWAFTLIGTDGYLSQYGGDREIQRVYNLLADKLFDRFEQYASADWVWPEETLTYCCGKLCHALMLAGKRLSRDDLTSMGLRSLKWLMRLQTNSNGVLSIVGNQGWYKKGDLKANFDQQPIEVDALLEACLVARTLTQDNAWLLEARRCFNWYMGSNDLGLALHNEKTGGCRDGLQANGVNFNEGAESILAWMLSLKAIRTARWTDRDFAQVSSNTETIVNYHD